MMLKVKNRPKIVKCGISMLFGAFFFFFFFVCLCGVCGVCVCVCV